MRLTRGRRRAAACREPRRHRRRATCSAGDTLTRPGAVAETRVVDVALQLLDSAKPLRHGARVRVHVGTVELLGRVALSGVDVGQDALRSPSGGAGAPGRAAEVPPGGAGARAASARSAHGRHAGRPLHPPGLLAVGDHRRRRRARPAPARAAPSGPRRAARGSPPSTSAAPTGDGPLRRAGRRGAGGQGIARDALSAAPGSTAAEVAAVVQRLVAVGRVTAAGNAARAVERPGDVLRASAGPRPRLPRSAAAVGRDAARGSAVASVRAGGRCRVRAGGRGPRRGAAAWRARSVWRCRTARSLSRKRTARRWARSPLRSSGPG